MNKLSIYLAAALLCLQLAACKKDKDADTAISIVGTWKLVENGNEETYYVYNEDRTRDELYESAEKRHSIYSIAYKLDGDVLTVGGSYIYKVRMSGDTLILSTGTDDETKLVKSTSVTKEGWVKIIEPEKVMAGLFSSAMTFDGFELVAAENSHYLYTKLTFINPVAKYITKTVPCAESYIGLEHADGKYWATKDNDERLYTVSPTTGAELSSSVQAGGDLYRIAGNNSTLYCATYNGRIYKYNIASALFDAGTQIGSFAIDDMAYYGGYLYIANDQYVYKLNTTDYKVEESYYFNGIYLSTIAFDGVGNAWMLSWEKNLLKAKLN